MSLPKIQTRGTLASHLIDILKIRASCRNLMNSSCFPNPCPFPIP